MQSRTIFEYIQQQEAQYKLPIPMNDLWNWSMCDHIKTSVCYKNSQLTTGNPGGMKPVKNITRPILNLQYRTEDIDVKDVQLYVDDKSKYHLSFLVKKYFDDVFSQEYDLDTYFDELNESRIDFGAGLSKFLGKPCPEVVPLQSIAFCDQTDMLSGPIAIKHFYSPDQLLEMKERGWGDKANGATATVEDVIRLSREEKKNERTGQLAKTPGRYIEVYEVHGNLPKSFANPDDTSEKYETRLFIVCFYEKQNGDKGGIILYTAKEDESPFKIIKRDPVFGRALGFGGAEELFEPQVWINYDMIRMQDMLDAASKTILASTDPSVSRKNSVKDMNNLDVLDLAPETDIKQVDTFPRNIALFDKSVEQWELHAQQMGAANDAIMGESPSSGTPFKLQELVTREAHSLHEYRRGKFAKHLEEVFKDWIIPHIVKKITQGATFLSELSLEELQYVTDCLVRNAVARENNERVLSGQLPLTEEEKVETEQRVKDEFKAKGNKHFIEILKGEFKGVGLGVKVNIAGKQKNLALRVDKLVNVFRAIMVNPAILQNPAMADLWNQIIEASGLNPVDFTSLANMPAQDPSMVAGAVTGKQQPELQMAA